MKKPLAVCVSVLIISSGVLTGCQTHGHATNKMHNQTTEQTNAQATEPTDNKTASPPISIQNGPIPLNITHQETAVVSGQMPVTTAANMSSNTTPLFLSATLGFVSANGGVHRTTDGGATWQTIGHFASEIISMDFTSAKTGLVLVRSGGDNIQANQQKVTYTWSLERTDDGGNTWHRVWNGKLTLPTGVAGNVGGDVVMENQDAYLFAGNQFLVSHDAGASWEEAHVKGQVEALAAPAPGTVYVATSTTPNTSTSPSEPHETLHVWKSTNSGHSFQSLMTSGPMSTWQAQFDFHDKQHGLLLVKDFADFTTTLYTTNDAGQHWKALKPDAFQSRVMQQTPVYLSDTKVLVALAPGAAPFSGGTATVDLTTGKVQQTPYATWRDAGISQFVSGTLYANVNLMNQQSVILKSTDNGQTWSPIFPVPTPTIAIDFLTDKLGYGLGMVGEQGYILKTTDGGTSWGIVKQLAPGQVPINLTFSSSQTGTVLVSEDTMATADSGSTTGNTNGPQILTTKDGGKNWSVSARPNFPTEISSLLSSPMAASIGFYNAAGSYWLSLASENEHPNVTTWQSSNGTNWKNSASIQLSKNRTGSISSYAMGPDGQMWVSTATAKTGGVFPYTTTIQAKSLDSANGSSSTSHAFTPFWTLPKGWIVLGMAHSTNQNAVLYAQNALAAPSKVAVFRTEDSGKHWIQENFPASDLPQPLNLWSAGAGASMSFVSANDGFLLTASGLLKTTNGGQSWTWT